MKMVGTQAQELLVINPLLYSAEEKYIWIDESVDERRNAQCLFDYLLKRKIYVNGFVSKSKLLTGLKMYNKKILGSCMLNKKQLIFSDTYFRPYCSEKEFGIQNARIINPDLDKREIVIWGAGITGDKVYQILAENGYTVKFFIDSAITKRNTFKFGLPVYQPEYLEDFEEDIVVIEAMENWKLLDDSIKERKWKRFHFNFEALLEGIVCDVNGEKKSLFSLASFWMFNHFVDKKVYIYGNGAIEKEFAEYLGLMDYDFCGFLIDCDEEEANRCKYIEEILYEEGYYIWIYDKYKAEKLNELGLKWLEQWECNGYLWDVTSGRKQGLDINLGFTLVTESGYPGIVVYGRDRQADYKIAVIGGSTADGTVYSFKSWPQLLYEELCEDLKKDEITIYNCGVSGYTSGQELIKLVRDVLLLNPNMIIVYDGGNELNIDIEHPFAFSYAQKIYEFANEHMVKDSNAIFTDKVCEGVASKGNRFDGWLFNIRNMHAIAKEHNIRFFSFCQPILSCKEGKTEKEKNMLLSMQSGQADFQEKEYFRRCFMERKDIPNYIFNFTNIFDNVDDVFMDSCHVKNEEGNRIVAGKIKEVIYETVLKDIGYDISGV